MKARMFVYGVVATLAAVPPLLAQDPPVQERRALERMTLTADQAGGRGGGRGGARGSVEGQLTPLSVQGVRVPMESQLVKGAPYSAEIVTESIQVLADGNRIVRKNTGRVYRDSQGRTRREDDREAGHPPSVSVTDPVAGIAFSLDAEPKIAWKTPYRTAGALMAKIPLAMPPPPPPPPPDPADPAQLERRRQVDETLNKVARSAGRGGRVMAPTVRMGTAGHYDEKTEALPARNVEGVMAEGKRTTRTIPAGAIGNEQPIVTVTEEWRSPELQVLVMTRNSDPRTGESTYRLLNIIRAEPDQSWFEVPTDYTIRESGVGRVSR